MKDRKLAPTPSPIALVGMGCRLPGGSRDVDSFWNLLVEGRSGITDIPADRWCTNRFYHPDPAVPARINTKRGGFVDHLKEFDAAFWGITPREALRMDPQQRWLLETAWEAIEDAGVAPRKLRRENVGVFVGISTHDYGSLQSDDLFRHDVHTNSGGTLSIAANRISYLFDFRGPSLSIDTACSSALVAVSMACQAIWSGQCKFALAGGVNAIVTPHASIGFTKASMLSPTGECFAFDERANGYVRGEGAGVVFLKPVDRAIQDDNPIYAVIKAAVVNQDGHTSSMTVPGVEGQSEMLRLAYQQANVSPHHVMYMEAHGTGTPVGDPIEAQALGSVLTQGRADNNSCLIGSVKTNVGHLEAGSGIAGLMKAALVLDRDVVPPSLNFRTPNPNIPFEQLKLKVASELQPLPHLPHVRPVAAVNSFGFGGTNAHVVLEAAPPSRPAVIQPNSSPADRPLVLPISARDDLALREYVKSYRKSLENRSLGLSDFCYSAGDRKEHHDHRLVVIGSGARQLRDRLDAWLDTNDETEGIVAGRADTKLDSLVFVFSGQGTQWWGMGRHLLEREPIVRQTLAEIDEIFQKLSGWSIATEMTRYEADSNISLTAIAQPALFALQVALTKLWNSWGVEATRVVGHSVGEVAAAYCAGCFTLRDAVHLIYHRSRLQQAAGGGGRMLVVGVPASQARELISRVNNRVEITAINSSELVTLGGDAEALRSIAAKLEADGRFVRWVKVKHAFHTKHMEPIKDELLRELSVLEPRHSKIPFVSTVTAQMYPGEHLDAKYWWHNVRSPVLFAAAISRQIQDGATRFLEIGPHPAMASSIQACLAQQGREGLVVHSLQRDTDESQQMLTNLARLHLSNVGVDWAAVNQSAGKFVRQPAYPWQYETYWLDVGEMASRLEAPLHPLLEKRITAAKPTWQFRLDPRLFPYLNDHRIWGDIVFPAAGYAEIGLALARQLFPKDSYTVEDVESIKALFTSEEEIPTVQVVFDEESKSFSVYSLIDGQSWELNARGRLVQRRPGENALAIDLAEVRDALSTEIAHEFLYEQLHALGYGFGSKFSQIQNVWRGEGQALVTITVPEAIACDLADYNFHPAVLDACFQSAFGAWDVSAESSSARFFYLPRTVGRIRLFCDKLPTKLWAHAREQFNDGQSIVCDILVYDDKGRPVAEVLGFCLERVEHQRTSDDVENCLYQFQWEPQRLRGSGLKGGCEFAPTAEIVACANSQSPVVYEEFRLRDYFTEFVPCLRQLTGYAIQNACIELGWDFRPGDRITFDEYVEKLGIVTKHQRLARAHLCWLEKAGTLRRDECGWRVVRCLADREIGKSLQSLADAFPQFAPEVGMHQATAPHLAAVLSGGVDPIDLFFPNGSNRLLEEFYTRGSDLPAYHQLIQEAVSTAITTLPPRRAVRVLEIGAGTGSLTRHLLKVLPVDRTEYLFTDISTAFLNAARARFGNYSCVDYQVFDVERDPEEQEFQPQSYDFIVAGNVLHATADLKQTFANIRKCLAPDGMLMLLELVQPCLRWDNLFGLLSGWWKFTDQNLRQVSPLLKSEQWERILGDCGFQDVGSFSVSPNEPEANQSVLVARGPGRSATEKTPSVENVLVRNTELILQQSDQPAGCINSTQPYVLFSDREGVADEIAHLLSQRGESIIQLHLRDAFRQIGPAEFNLASGSADELRRVFACVPIKDLKPKGFVHCWSLDRCDAISMTAGMLTNSQAHGVLSGLHLVQFLAQTDTAFSPRVFYVTRGAQSTSKDDLTNGLVSSPLIGFARVANSELERFRWTLIDLDEQPDDLETESICDEITLDSNEREVAFRNNCRYVNRLQRVRLEDVAERRENVLQSEECGVSFRLQIRKPGALANLQFNETPRCPPGPNEIEVRVQAGGINFRDVMKALGIYPGNPIDLRWLGDDFSGIVERVGSDIRDLRPGDRVAGIAQYAFRSFVTVDRRMVFKQPQATTYEEAATLPTVFLTAQYAIHHLARMEAGEKILIHSAAGGVGQAAIQIARREGLEIFATAGTVEKRQLLKDMGVQHVLDSRTLDFADQIAEITKGQGVDAVLNSLAGEFIPKSLSILAPFGRFLEIGKVDVYGDSKLRMATLKENISYHVIDLAQLIQNKPSRVTALFEELRPRFEAGDYSPLIHKVFPVAEAAEAFRHMAQGKHIGKNVLRFGQDSIAIGPLNEEGQLFRSDATYFITGGAGGFGLEVAKWMAQQGARTLVLMSRSGPNEADLDEIERLRATGVRVLDIRGDVTRKNDVNRVIRTIQRECPPLRGVVHAAMVLDDESLTQLNEERFNRVFHPKAVGAWNVHTATLEIPLDHFICFSSLSAVFGAARQANYNAGNCFLDALAHHRRALGIAGLTINWGAISGAGFVERNKKTADYLASIGHNSIRVQEALKILGELIRRDAPQIAVGRLDWRQLRKLSSAIASSPTYDVVTNEQTNNGTAKSLRRRLADAASVDQLTILADFVVEQISGVFGIEPDRIDRSISLTELGLDSLMAVELVNRVESESGLTIAMGNVLNGPSVQQLALILQERLCESIGASESSIGESRSESTSLIPLGKSSNQRNEFPLTLGARDQLLERRNVFCVARLQTMVDSKRLRQAFRAVLQRHPMLRTSVAKVNGSRKHQVQPAAAFDLAEYDVRSLGDEKLNARIADHLHQPIYLQGGRLVRLELFRCRDGRDIVALSNHPVVADAQAATIAFSDLVNFYRTASGVSAEATEEVFTYLDYAEWQQAFLNFNHDAQIAQRWLEHLEGARLDVDLPADRPRTDKLQYRQESLAFELDEDLSLQLHALSAEYGVGMRDTLFAAFTALTHHCANQNDLLIGYCFDGRSHAELQRVVGQFENWLPVRSQLESSATFRDHLIATARSVALGCEAQLIPFPRLLNQLNRPPSASEGFRLQVAFGMPSYESSDEQYVPFQLGRAGHVICFGDLSIESIDVCPTGQLLASGNESAPQFGCDLRLVLGHACDRVLGWWHFNGELFDRTTIQSLNDLFHRVLEAAVNNPLKSASHLLADTNWPSKARAGDEHVRSLQPQASRRSIEFEEDSRLEPDIKPSGDPPTWDVGSPHVLLTGATGFVGAHLLVELLNRTSSTIVCLVRGSDEATGLDRIRENLASYELDAWGFDKRVRAVIGDLSKPLLGLSHDAFERIAADVGVIYHNGAEVNLALPYSALRSANVLGTREILRLACRRRTKPVHMVSTFTVHTTDANRGRIVTETDPLPPCRELLYGYSQTKWVAEKLIAHARERGLPVAVYRPGHVIGDNRTGISNTDDLLHTLVLTCIRMGAAPQRDVELDLTPVNYVASAIADLSLRPESLGQTFHLTNPKPLKMKVLMNWVRAMQLDVEFVADEPWRERLLRFAEQVPARADEIRVLADILVPRALAKRDAHALHPVFDCNRTQHMLASAGIRCAPADETMLQTGLNFLRRTGLATNLIKSEAA